MTSPDGTALPSVYPEAGGIAMILYGANGNIYYQFSDPAGAFVGFQGTGNPAAFRGNPFTINNPLTLDCGIQTCNDYFGNAIVKMEIRFTAGDGDTQQGGFDEDDISLLLNGVNIGNWSDIPTQNTNTAGTTLISSQLGYGNGTFDTGWFSTTNTALLSDILTTETILSQVFDDDPNDNYWNFARGNSLTNPGLERVSPAYTLEKRARSGSFTGPEITSYSAVGDVVFYTYDVFNSGNVRIDNLSVSDDQLGAVTCAPTTILTGETAVCQASYTIQQSDIDNETIVNVATATGTPEFGQLGTLSDTVTLNGPTLAPSISITKTPDATTFGNAGTNFPYSFEVENTGNATLTNVVVTDPLIPSLSCSVASLAPNGTLNCNANYTITQADVDRGFVTNTASVTSLDPNNVARDDTSQVTNTAVVNPAFSVVKATSSAPTQAGDTLDYTFTVANDGNITISGINVADVNCAAAPTLTSGDTDSDTDLDVGETHIYSCTSIAVTQPQVDAGQVDNAVTVSGTPATGTLPNANDTLSTPISPAPGFTIAKATSSAPTQAGQTLTYTFDVVNTGNVTISSVAVTDAKCAAAPTLQSENVTANGDLDATETQVYQCTSIPVTQAEVDAGEVVNTATVSGNVPGGAAVPPVGDTLTTPINRAPAFSVVKANTTTPTAAGQTIDYTFTLSNDGNVTINGINVSDAKCASPVSLDSGDTNSDGVLDVGETHVYGCTSIPVTQAEVDAGVANNSVSVAGSSATGPLTPATDTHAVAIVQTPELTLDKALQAASPTSYDSVGDVLLYDFIVTNTGNVSITSAVSITDPLLDAAASCPPLPGGGLPPGGSITCTGQATMDQGDIDAGSFTNSATATDGTTTSNSDDVTVNAVQTSGLTVDKSATEPVPFLVGAVIDYTYVVTNTGNTTIPDTATINVNDNRVPVSCPVVPTGGIAPNGTLTCTASYTVTAADLQLGTVTNLATATDGTTTSPSDSATVPAGVVPALSLTKTAQAPTSFTAVGDTLSYAFEVQNTGGGGFTQTITVSDDKINGGAPFDCWVPSGPTDTFSPDVNYPTTTNGETFTCFQNYTVTQADVDAGEVVNQAFAETVFAPGGAAIPVASAPVTETVTSTPNASMSVAKTASPTDLTPAAPGDIITYEFTAQNTGDITLSDVEILDSGPTFGGVAGTGTFSTISVTAGPDSNTDGRADTLAPAATATFEATYILTQADIDAAAAAADPAVAIANSASGTAIPATGTLDPVTPSTATTGFAPNPAFTVAKTSSSVPAQAGDTLDYMFFVENTGNLSISGLAVTDAKCAAAPILVGGDLNSDTILDVVETHEYSCTSIPVTQAEIDAGQVDNAVSVSGTPSGGTLPPATDTLSTPVTANSGFDIAKSTSSPAPTQAGDTLVYDFVLTNSGNVSIVSVNVADAKCATPPVLQSGDADSDGELDPNETWNYSCTSIAVTQAEVDAGQVDNTATVDGNEPGGAAIPQDSVSISTPVTPSGSFTVAKSTTDTPSAAGDVLNYQFVVNNTGNVSVENVVVTDAKCAAAPVLQTGSDANADNALNPTETWTYTCASIPVTQAEVDAGQVSNTVSVAGNTPGGAVIPPADDTLNTPVTVTPSWTLAKSTSSTPMAAGDTLVYSFDVANTGNVSITGTAIADAKCAAAPVLTAATDVFSDGVLSPAETWTFTCTSIPVTQAEIDAGQVDNAATATGTPATGTLPPANGTNSTAVGSTPGLDVAKSTASTPTAAGDTLSYQFVVTNTGNTSLNTVNVSDAKCAAAPALQAGSDANADNALNPTETWTYTCTSIPVTQAEADAGAVDNDVTITALDPSGGVVPPATDAISTPVASNAVWNVAKASSSTPTAEGETLDYTFTVNNTGNVSIENIVVTDAKCAATASLQSGDANSDNALNPSETWVYACTSIPVTQAEVDAGVVANSVSLAGDEPNGTPLPPATDDNTVAIAPAPGVTSLKTITSTTTTVGGLVTFEITAQNTGNVTLTGVALTDTLLRADSTPLTLASGPSFSGADAGSSVGTLLPNEIATYTASYVLTQDDIDAGGLSNSATATGTPPTGAPVSDVSDDGVPGNGDDNPTVLTITPSPSIDFLKTLAQVTKADSSTASSFDTVGDRLDYTFTVTNTGNVTLDGPVSVDDPLILTAGGTVNCPTTILAPTETLDCTGSYTITQADIDAGQVDNVATVSDGLTTPPPSGVTVPAIQSPAITMVKTAQPVPPAAFVVGATVTYDYVITNDGNTTITQPITVTDNLITNPADLTCNPWPGSLAPGATYSCQGVYTVTADDVDLGSVTNLAEATDGTTPAPPVTQTIPSGAIPALSITKTSVDTTFATVGDILTYSFEVENSGTQAFVRPITVVDDQIGTITCWTPVPVTDPDFTAGETAICTAPYTVTQADLDAGFVTNNAFARTSFGAGTDVVSAPDNLTINAATNPLLDLTKSVALPAGKTTATLVPGDVLSYTLTVENTGNQTLNALTVSDPLLGLSCSVATLNVGASDSSCVGTLTIQQSDIDAGSIDNAASATGSDPSGATITATDNLVTPMPAAAPGIELTKTANPSPFGAVGTSVVYAFAVENTGNVTLTNASVTDPLLPSLSCTIASLAPGVTDTTCSQIYTVTQADVDAGGITNTASVTASDPSSGPVTDTDQITTGGPAAAPSLEATKTFASTGTTPGSVVTFTIRVANTGNVSLSSVTPVDTLTRLDGTSLAFDGAGLTLSAGDTDADNEIDVGETWEYTASYTLVQDDINQGGIRNIFVANTQDPNGTPVNDTADDGDDGDGNTTDDPTEVLITPGPAIMAEKTISSTTGSAAGDTLTFDIVVNNQGNVDLRNIALNDALTRADGTVLALTTAPALVSGDVSNPGVLDVTETWTYQATYVLQQADIDAGGVSNSVEATGTDPSNSPVSDVADDGDDTDGNAVDDPTEFLVAPMPMIEAEKIVVTGATAVGDTIAYEINVQNTGNVTLTGVGVVDTLTRSDGTVLALTTGPVFASSTSGSPAGTLLPGEVATYDATYLVVQEDIDEGGVSNTALVSGSAPNGAGVTDISDDPAALVDTGPSDPTETTFAQNPSIVLGKTVQSEQTLLPYVYEVVFDITVENNGNVTQTGIQVADDLAAFAAPATVLNTSNPAQVSIGGFTSGSANPAYDGVTDANLLTGGASVAPGDTGTITVTVVYTTATGFPAPGTNTATASTDQIPNPPPATATVTVTVDTDGDGAPDNLESTTNDRDGDGIPDAQDYDPTGYLYCEEDGRLLLGAQITVTGGGFSQTGVGVDGPINIVRDGSTGEYQFFVTTPGTYTLSWTPPTDGVLSTITPGTAGPTDVTNLVDVLTGTTTTNPRILGSGESGGSGNLANFTPAANPTHYTTFVFEAGDPFIFSNNIAFQACTPSAPLVATKTVIGRSNVRIGDLVTYQVQFDLGAGGSVAPVDVVDLLPTGISYVPNSGSISTNGAPAVATEPTIAGQRLTWTGQTIPGGGSLTILLSGRVMPNAPTGEMTNQAYAQDAAGDIISNIATATVERVPEHVFDCSDVIGRVFEDLNGNGYPDGPVVTQGVTDQAYLGGKGKAAPAPVTTYDERAGEPGLPGVRVVTSNGILITTDEFGRFHVPCASLPEKIGSNFILKVDERSLPTGYRMTTENPRVVRLTAGKFAKMNFGAAINRVVRINLNANAFTVETTPNAKLENALRNLVRKMSDEPSVIRLTYSLGASETEKAARAKLRVVEKMISREWRQHGHYKLNIERTIRRRQ